MILPRTLMVLGLALGAGLGATSLGGAADYSCGDATSHHCYASRKWQDEPEYFGVYSDIRRNVMSCSGCDGFLTNEIWILGHTDECLASRFHHCWAEAGYIRIDSQQSTAYFWADLSPDGAFRLAFPGTSHTILEQEHFMIVKDARQECPGRFLIFMYNTSLTTLWSATSVSFPADQVVLGSELAGSHGLSAGTATFMKNIWAVAPLGPEYVFWYRPQETPGEEWNDEPPFGKWDPEPASGSGPEGGVFLTHCCG